MSAADAEDFKTYMGLSAGMFKVKYAENNAQGSLLLDKWTWGTFLTAGAQYKNHLAAELRLGTIGRTGHNFPANIIGNAQPFDLTIGNDIFISYLAKPMYPISDLYRIYGIFGGTAGKFYTHSSAGVLLGQSTWKTGVTYGLGLEYQFRLKGSVAIEWVEYWSDVTLGMANGAISNASMRGVSMTVNKSF